ncbi:MAG: hypothetical protein JRH06_07645 [Deltaproteobacteria bacterium]|nr:hypothetical protein [Deltaproteobacteria bacterium]MBW2137415.1 hypothetical protein [Deltaproteobacteria bacterium]
MVSNPGDNRLNRQLHDDYVPVITCFFWKVDSDHGNVIIKNKQRRKQNLILDKQSSEVWLNIDGMKTISELRALSSKLGGFEVEPFLRELESYGLISYKQVLEDNW